MTSFNLTAITQETPLIQRKAKSRIILPRKTSQIFTLNSFIFSTFILLGRFSSRIPSTKHGVTIFQKESHG